MQIVARIMANSQKTTANKTTTSITLQPRDSPAGDGLEKLYLEQPARGKGVLRQTHTLKCHLTNWSSDLAKKQSTWTWGEGKAIEKPSGTER